MCEAATVLIFFMAGTCFDNDLPQQMAQERERPKNLLNLVGVLAR